VAFRQPREGGWRIVYQKVLGGAAGGIFRAANLSELQVAGIWLSALREGGRVLVKPERDLEDKCWGEAPHEWCLSRCERCKERRERQRPSYIHPAQRAQRQALAQVVSISPVSAQEVAAEPVRRRAAAEPVSPTVTPDQGAEPSQEGESGSSSEELREESSSEPSSDPSSAEEWKPRGKRELLAAAFQPKAKRSPARSPAKGKEKAKVSSQVAADQPQLLPASGGEGRSSREPVTVRDRVIESPASPPSEREAVEFLAIQRAYAGAPPHRT
jgi:hypothetical protein